MFSLSVAAMWAAQSGANAASILGLFQTITGTQDAAVAPAQAAPTGNLPVQLAAATAKRSLRDGTYTGQAYDAYYGLVQVEATVQSGQIANINTLQSPDHRSTSRAINRQALPILEREVIQAQTLRVNIVSGATLTSRAYLRSLNSALKQALQ